MGPTPSGAGVPDPAPFTGDAHPAPPGSTGATGTTDSGHLALIARGAGIVFTGTALSFLFRYGFQILVARSIGAELYGVFSLALSVFAVAEVTAGLGANKGVIRFVPLYQIDRDMRRARGVISMATRLALVGGACVALLVACGAESLGIGVFHSPALVPALRLIAVAIPLSALTTVAICATQGLKLMRYQVLIRDTTEQVVRIAVVAALLSLGLELWAAAWAFVVSLAVGTMVSSVVRQRVVAPRLHGEGPPIREWRTFLGYCWPFLPTNLIAIIEMWLTTFMVGSLLSSADVGVFSAAYRTVFLVQGILLSFNTVFSPLISGLWHQGDRNALAGLFKIVSAWTLVVSLPPLLLMALVPREVMGVFGPEYRDGSDVLVMLTGGQVIMSSTGSLGVMIDMSGRSRLTLLNAVPHLCVQAAIALVCIPRFGIAGAAYAKVASTAFLRLLQLVEVRHVLGMHPFGKAYLRPIMAGASGLVCAGLVGWVSGGWGPTIRLVVVGCVLIAAYGMCFVAQGFTAEERMLLRKARSRLGR